MMRRYGRDIALVVAYVGLMIAAVVVAMLLFEVLT